MVIPERNRALADKRQYNKHHNLLRKYKIRKTQSNGWWVSKNQYHKQMQFQTNVFRTLYIESHAAGRECELLESGAPEHRQK